MVQRQLQIRSCRLVALLLACMLLAMAPFAVALEIHHDLAGADHDGHEHSDTDLCQWVQYHTGYSIAGDVPIACALLVESPSLFLYQPIFISQALATTRTSRAPPLS